MKRLLLLGCLIAAVGCTSPTQTLKQDGTSIATAVIIDAPHQADSPRAERAWIERNLPGARPAKSKPNVQVSDGELVSFSHSLLARDNKIYSATLVELADGSERTVYFDITACFGR